MSGNRFMGCCVECQITELGSGGVECQVTELGAVELSVRLQSKGRRHGVSGNIVRGVVIKCQVTELRAVALSVR